MNILKRSWLKRTLFNSFLLAFLAAIFIAYAFAVIDLPSRLYTSVQRAYILENDARIINQVSPTWNVLPGEGGDPAVVIPVKENQVKALLKARVEEKEGINVTVYDLAFHARYLIVSPRAGEETRVELFFPFPDNLKTLYEVSFQVDGQEPVGALYLPGGISWATTLKAGEERAIEIAYRAEGASSFGYSLSRGRRTDVDVQVTVEGLAGSQLPGDALPATQTERLAGQEVFHWNYQGLIATRDVAILLPARPSFIQRAAEMQRIFRVLAMLAPLLVAGFLVALFGLFWLANLNLPLEHYLMTGIGLALFYPLLTFLSGMMEIYLAAPLALLLSGGLIVIFLSTRLGYRQAGWRAGLLLALFPGLFSLGMLTPWKGLFVSGGAFLLVAAWMILYACRPRPVIDELPKIEDQPVAKEESAPVEEREPAARRCCPNCGTRLEESHHFCPSCGYDIRPLRRCAACGKEQIPPKELEKPFCLQCGAGL